MRILPNPSFVCSSREMGELREQKLGLDLQVEELQTRGHSLSSSLKQRDQEVQVSRTAVSCRPRCGLGSLWGQNILDKPRLPLVAASGTAHKSLLAQTTF